MMTFAAQLKSRLTKNKRQINLQDRATKIAQQFDSETENYSFKAIGRNKEVALVGFGKNASEVVK